MRAEELARLTYYSAGIRRRFDVPVRMAIIDDVGESYCMGLAQVLARSGVKWFCTGPGAKANVKGIINKAPRIFYWDSPDGSRVLSAWTPGIWTYARWSAAGFKGNSTLQEFDSLPGYPYDIMFRHGGKGDISSPDPKMLELIDSYRKECPEADIKLSTAQEFFTAVEKKYAADIPTWRGDVADSSGRRGDLVGARNGVASPYPVEADGCRDIGGARRYRCARGCSERLPQPPSLFRPHLGPRFQH